MVGREAGQSRQLAGTTVRLRHFEPTRIEGRVVDAEGDPLDVRLSLGYGLADDDRDWQISAGAIDLSTTSEGLRFLLVVDDVGDRPTRMIPVMLPRRGDGVVVDLGTIQLVNERQLTLLNADGEPVIDGSVTLLRAGWHDTDRGVEYPIVGEGQCTLPDLQAGDAALVTTSPSAIPADSQPRLIDLPTRFVLTGTGPWQLRQNPGKLLVDARTAGAARSVAVTIGDRLLTLREPSLLLGLAPGRHQVFVAAAGHRTAITTVDVPATGVARLEVTLPAR